MLIVEVGFQCQFGAAVHAFEAAGMEEGKVFEGANPVHLVNDLVTPQTG